MSGPRTQAEQATAVNAVVDDFHAQCWAVLAKLLVELGRAESAMRERIATIIAEGIR